MDIPLPSKARKGEHLVCLPVGSAHRVARFVEKPNLDNAEKFLAAGRVIASDSAAIQGRGV